MSLPAYAMRHGTSTGVPMYNWRTHWDWTNPEDGPASWAEHEAEHYRTLKAQNAERQNLKTVSVRVLNGLESSVKRCSVESQTLCEMTSMPILRVRDGDRILRCEWYDGEWTSDLDQLSY